MLLGTTTLSSAISCPEIGTTGMYSGNMAGAAGRYSVFFYASGVLVDSGEIDWDGTAEITGVSINSKTINLPSDPASNTQVNTRMATFVYTTPPTAAAIRIETETSSVLAKQAKLDLVEAATTPNLTVATSTLATTAALSAVATTVNTINTNTDTIESRLPTVLIGGKMDSTATDISSLATAAALSSVNTAVNAINLNTDTVESSLTTITAALPTAGAKIAGEGATVKNLDQLPTVAAIVTGVFSFVVEETLTFKEFLRIGFAVLAGKTTGVGTSQNEFKGVGGTIIRLRTTFDTAKNRLTVFLYGGD